MATVVCGEILHMIFKPKKSARIAKGIKVAVFLVTAITSAANIVTAALALRCSLPTLPTDILVAEFVVLVVSRGLTIVFAFAAMYSHTKLVQEMGSLDRKERMIRSGGYEGSRDNELGRATGRDRPTRRSNRSSGGA